MSLSGPKATARSSFDRGWLPAPLTRFVGRENVLGTLVERVPTSRLLTVTGPAGSGKSRLAREAAAQLISQFPGGVYWVDLSQIQDPALLPQQIAMSVGISPSSGELVAGIGAWSRKGFMLVVMDSCEHVIDAATHSLATLLEGCEKFFCLATSRELLGIRGERVIQVPPLTVPAAHANDRTEILQAESVELFLDRVWDVMPTYELTDQEAPLIAEICRRLSGIPLAIELAAARLPILGATTLLDRLQDKLSLLTSRDRTAIPRHRTLRAAIDWSYESLSQGERTLFARLSVFAGGFSLSSVEEVCSGDGLERGQILDLLTALVGKSLVNVGEGPHAVRYTLLELLGQYVEERLVEAGTAAVFRQRHAEHFVRVAETAESHVDTPARSSWTELLRLDLANLRTALVWTRTQAPRDHLSLVGSLAWFWFETEQGEEGLEWLEQALRLEGVAGQVRAKLLLGIGLLNSLQGKYERGQTAAAGGEPGASDGPETNERLACPSTAPPGLEVLALGPLKVAVGGVELPVSAWSHAKPRELLVYLLCHPDGYSRGKIGQDFWPDRSPEQAKNNFHVALHFLRRALGRPEWVLFDGQRYRLAVRSGVRFDMLEFESQLGAALNGTGLPEDDRERRLKDALALYRGDLLASEPVGTWVLDHRDRTRTTYVTGLWVLAGLLFESGRYQEAVEVLRRLVAADELHEEAVRMLMISLARLGERVPAIRHFERLAAVLERDLSATPEPESILLNERLLRAEPV